ncbi:unnamed protein product [Calypogeia fissa]
MASAAATTSVARILSRLPSSSPTLSRPSQATSRRLVASSSTSFCGLAALKAAALRRQRRSSVGFGDEDSSGNVALTGQHSMRFRRDPCGTAVCALHEGKEYEFREDGSELEVRVPLPSEEDAGRRLTARYVAVDAQATSLVVGVETVRGVQILLNASSLFGSIKPSETVWFVDETEIVISLKKADDELSWPDLIEVWQSLAKGVSTLLKGTSVYVVGESTEINWAVAQELAAGLEYVPLQTQQLIEHVAKASIDEIIKGDGEDSIGDIEEAILRNLSQHVRCVVATLGGNNSAAAQYRRWNGLHAGFSVWLSQSQAHDEESAKEEVVRVKKTGSLGYSKADVAVALSGWDSTAVRPTAEGSLRALKYLLMAEKDLPGKKSLYVRLGCRGDWPDIMPPGWDPNRPEDEVKRAEELAV